MQKLSLSIFLTLFSVTGTFAQLTGIKTIPGSYASLLAAVTDLNTQGVGSGGVTFNVAAGYTETAPSGGILLTATGTTTNPVIFQKTGSGSNPKITATDAGSIATTIFGGQGDAVIIIQGSDYVTFNGIDVAATQSGIEYGYYLRKSGSTNGCKNVTIKNAAITLTKGISPYVVGIYASNNVSTSTVSSNSGITVTSASGINENISITGDTISNVATGIAMIGYNAASPYDLYDQNFTIGANGMGNTIQNFAGNATAGAYGVYMIYVKSADISYNTIANSAGGGTAATGTLSGIYFDTNASGTGSYTASNNTFTLSQLATAALNYIYNGSTITSFTANSNRFAAANFASTTTSYLIYNNNNTPAITVNNNQTVGTINKTGNGSFYCYYNNGGSPTAGTTASYSGNNFSNITMEAGTMNEFAGIYASYIGSQVFTVTNNTISNISGNINSMYGLRISYGKDNSVISGNTITSLYGGFTVVALYQDYYTGSVPLTISGNTIGNITAGYVIGLSCGNQSSNINVYKNKIYDINLVGGSAFAFPLMLANGTSGATNNIHNNLIGNVNAPAATSPSEVLRAVSISGGSSTNVYNFYYNTVYLNVVSSGANLNTAAFYQSTPGTLNLRNNILINITAPKGTGTTMALRRTDNTLSSYASTSNNNLLYTGTPSPNTLIYTDGASTAQTLANFKTLVAPRESASVSDLPAFISTIGSSPNYLHITPNSATQANNGAIPVDGITDDYDGQLRSTTTPDIGADEFDMALPIKFEYLIGKKIGNTNALNWKLTCTSTSITMVLERSADARTFDRTITIINATQARCGQPFDAVDATPLNGISYYRLKMIDVDGKVSYSPVAAVMNGKAGAELVGIYPTVVKDQAYLSITSSRNTTMQFSISDMTGKVVTTISQAVGSGSSLLPVSTANLASGVYNITGLLDGTRTQTLRFVKQ